MRPSRALLIFALVAGGLVSGSLRAGGPAQAGTSSANMPHVTRVFYLQGMEPREAMTLLRSQVQVRQMAMIQDSSAIVVSDVADRVDQSEKLLRERDAVVRATDPHDPLELEGLAASPTATRVFRVESVNLTAVATILRSIYQVREVNTSAEENSVSVRGAKLILDSSEALLRELGLLAEPAKISGSS